MFSYYGSKSKLVKWYPQPTGSVIVEPFAGSARYALEYYYDREVYLFDANPLVVELWHYLQAASEKDILGLPVPPSKKHIDNYESLTQVEKNLIGFHLCRGKARPRKVGHGQNGWGRDKERIAASLHKIRHWKIECRSYLELTPLANRLGCDVTWFVDPPYQRTQVRTNSDRYPYGDGIDYQSLAEMCREVMQGQLIVCEGSCADWLDFELLKKVTVNSNNLTTKQFYEMLYYRPMKK